MLCVNHSLSHSAAPQWTVTWRRVTSSLLCTCGCGVETWRGRCSLPQRKESWMTTYSPSHLWVKTSLLMLLLFELSLVHLRTVFFGRPWLTTEESFLHMNINSSCAVQSFGRLSAVFASDSPQLGSRCGAEWWKPTSSSCVCRSSTWRQRPTCCQSTSCTRLLTCCTLTNSTGFSRLFTDSLLLLWVR